MSRRVAQVYLLVVLFGLSGSPPLAAPAGIRLSEADYGHYQNAFLHANRGNALDARLHAARAANTLPAKVVHWLLLCEMSESMPFAEAYAFVTDNPQWPQQSRLQRAVERSMPWDLPAQAIIDWFETHPALTVDGAMRHIAALRRIDRADEATRMIRDTWRSGNFDTASAKAFRTLYGTQLNREDHIARLDHLLWSRNSRHALALARSLGGGYPELAQARLALAEGAPGVDEAIRRVPMPLADDLGLVYERALWRRNKNRYEGVVDLLTPLAADTPQAERWWPLRHWAAREALARGDYETAYRLAANHGLGAGVAFAEAQWLAGWIAHRFLAWPDAAYANFIQLYAGSNGSISLARGAFWAGEAAATLGDAEQAEHWYTTAAHHGTAFYGQLASLRLGAPNTVDITPVSPPSRTEREHFDRSELVKVVRLLGQLRQGELQQLFLLQLADLAKNRSEYQLVVDLALEQTRPAIALEVAKQARYEGIWLPEALFPIPTQMIAAGETELEQALVLAVVRQESAFDARAISHAGARGLMQLMPATAKAVAQSLDVSYSSERLTADPAYNLLLGRAYLARLVERYDGSPLLALAAYNAGPGRVRRWIALYGDPRDPDVDPVLWIESLPFSETRNYVMRVLESLTVYRQRLADSHEVLPVAWH